MPLIRKIFVVLPAFNEEEALSSLLPKITQTLSQANRSYELLVVNDGSSDQTSSLLTRLSSSFSVRELNHSLTLGYGTALKTGFLWALSNAGEEDAVVTLDADNTHDPMYIPLLITKLEQGFDVVTASYTREGAKAYGVPRLRRFMSQTLNALLRMVHPLPGGAATYTNGFRAYGLSIMRKVQRTYPDHLIDEAGFPGGLEFFLKCASEGARFSEIPFDLHYENRGSASKIKLAATVAQYLKLMGMAYQLR